MKKLIITNNPLVNEYFSGKEAVSYFEKHTLLEILNEARNKVHLGHLLLTHPLSGSIKPNETPYKTVVVSEKKKQLDFNSLSIIEEGIKTSEKFLKDMSARNCSDKILKDFQLIDFDLIKNAL